MDLVKITPPRQELNELLTVLSAEFPAETSATVDDPAALLRPHSSTEADLADSFDSADSAWVMHWDNS